MLIILIPILQGYDENFWVNNTYIKHGEQCLKHTKLAITIVLLYFHGQHMYSLKKRSVST